MREIKFRAKDSDGKWVYSNDDVAVFWCGIDDGKYNIETLGQFTGLKDKNGVEIFESDIVKYQWFANNGEWIGGDWIVRYGEASTFEIDSGDQFIGFFLELLNPAKKESASRTKGDHRSILGINGSLEILGSIHDNPELLK